MERQRENLWIFLINNKAEELIQSYRCLLTLENKQYISFSVQLGFIVLLWAYKHKNNENGKAQKERNKNGSLQINSISVLIHLKSVSKAAAGSYCGYCYCHHQQTKHKQMYLEAKKTNQMISVVSK